MRYRLVFPLLVFMFLLQPLCATAKPVRFAPLPVHSEDYIRREYYPFTEYLQHVLQQPVEIAFRHNLEDVLNGLMSDEIDLAHLWLFDDGTPIESAGSKSCR
ncbi:MAG: hypothetical protein JRG71_00535 [Deltaproteobacteria bacterium]|nr:hypothetical protein [Deltaproteobacteria bacterium]